MFAIASAEISQMERQQSSTKTMIHYGEHLGETIDIGEWSNNIYMQLSGSTIKSLEFTNGYLPILCFMTECIVMPKPLF